MPSDAPTVPPQEAAKARRSLARELLAAVIPAYVFPFATSFPGGLVTGDPELLAASTTTIPIPGALAAALVIVVARVLDARRPAQKALASLPAAALAFGVCGALGLVVMYALVRAGLCSPGDYGYACPSAAIGGAVTAFTWIRRGRSGRTAHKSHAAVGALSMLFVIVWSGCAPALPRISTGVPRALSHASSLGVETTSAQVLTLRGVANVCAEWAKAADERAAERRSAQTRAGRISAIAGTLGTGAGVATAVLSATANNSDTAAKYGQVGGATALSFGIAAGLAGMLSNVRGHDVVKSLQIAVGIEQAMHRRVESVLLNPPGETRDASASRESSALLVDCARYARRLPGLEDLPVEQTPPTNVAQALAILRAGSQIEPGTGSETYRLVTEALHGETP